MSFNKEEVNKIAILCGGYFWLIKQVIRTIRDNPSLKFNDVGKSSQVQIAIEQLYNSFLESERNVLQNLIQGKRIESDIEKHSLEYLKKISLVNGDKITIPLLDEYIREHVPKIDIELRNDKIYMNSVNIENHFSQKEKRIFITLLRKRNNIISRDELAKAIWPINTEEFYSDWAVDRIVARLRNKVEELGFSKDVIKTYRNKGYVFEENS